jgi:glutathione S-transferase
LRAFCNACANSPTANFWKNLMNELTIWTYDWVQEGPRGFVRDVRLRWACEEAGLGYSARTIPFDDRGPDHLARRPFGQVPFLSDGEVEIFESGAGLLMADVLRVSKVCAFGDRTATEAYVKRVTDRPSFKKAQADQIRHFEEADDKK